MLIDIPPRRILGRFIAEPLPAPGTFDGQTVLVTGSTTGLGLATAVHYASLGAHLFITCRNHARGEAARQHIEQAAGTVGRDKITILDLEMSQYASCVALVDNLKRNPLTVSAGLNIAVLNAGSINSRFEKSSEGW